MTPNHSKPEAGKPKRGKQDPRTKFTKPRVVWACRRDFPELGGASHSPTKYRESFVILPLPARQARTLVRFANMTEGERVDAVARVMYLDDVGFRRGEPTWESIKHLPGNAITEAFTSRARAALQRLGLGEGA